MRPRTLSSAFSLIELIASLAIIGILASIVIPTAGATQRSVGVARTRIQWAQWASAIESFRLEYGVYPDFHASGKVNGGAGTSAASEHPFHDSLTGRRRSGTVLAPTEPVPGQNFKQIRFASFTEHDWGPGEALHPLLCDAFENPDIAVVVDRNGDGMINASDCADFPTVSPVDNPSIQLRPGSSELGPNGVSAAAIFYSAPPGASAPAQLLMSWR